jgi:hypothetical protein
MYFIALNETITTILCFEHPIGANNIETRGAMSHSEKGMELHLHAIAPMRYMKSLMMIRRM